MNSKHPLKIALASDNCQLIPSVVAICSVLEQHIANKVTVHFLGEDLSTDHRRLLDAICMQYPNAKLEFSDIVKLLPCPLTFFGRKYPKAVYGRMLLPELVDGRVLYLDSDTYTHESLQDLFQIDLKNNCMAAVRDTSHLRNINRRNLSEYELDRVEQVRTIMRPFPEYDYFNSGVMLLDCDKIRANGKLFKDFVDVQKAFSMSMLDQDYLNLKLKGNVSFLSTAYNCDHGASRKAFRIEKSFVSKWYLQV